MQPLTATTTTARAPTLLGGGVLRQLLTLDVVVPAIEAAYVAHSRGQAQLFPVVREPLPEGIGVFGVKSGLWRAHDVLGLKIAGFWPANRSRGLDNHQATVILLDPASGVPRAIMDGNWITAIRTSAAGAIAAKWLARPDARRALVIGTGVQAEAQARGLAWWRGADLELVAHEPLDGPDRELARAFVERLAASGISARVASSLEDEVRAADLVVTATPSTAPLVARAWLRPGTHVNAIGADTRGKQEHELATLRDARIVVDDWPQAMVLGECQHGVAAGLFADGPPATIGEVLAGTAPGRAAADEITLFDATGIALQDLAVAELAMRLASEAGLGIGIGLD
jgi:ornithine cyclodeaminase